MKSNFKKNHLFALTLVIVHTFIVPVPVPVLHSVLRVHECNLSTVTVGVGVTVTVTY